MEGRSARGKEDFDFYIMIATASNRDGLLKRTLESIIKCRKPGSFNRVVVIENGPKGDVEELVDELSDLLPIEYCYVAEANKSKALNVGLGMIGDGFVLFTDDDIRFDPDVLMHYDAAVRIHGYGHYYGGPLGVDCDNDPEGWMLGYLPRSAKGVEWRDADPKIVFLGGNWGAFKSDIIEVGGYLLHQGPSTSATGEESDLQRRLQKMGCNSINVKRAKVWHYVPASVYTTNWILNRAERHGVEIGHRLRDDPPTSLKGWIDIIWWFFYLKVPFYGLSFLVSPKSGYRCVKFLHPIRYRRGVIRGWLDPR